MDEDSSEEQIDKLQREIESKAYHAAWLDAIKALLNGELPSDPEQITEERVKKLIDTKLEQRQEKGWVLPEEKEMIQCQN